MALKTIKYAVTVDGISPNTVQFGGTQGDHNVFELVFELDTKLYDSVMTSGEKVVYRFDGYDGQGNVVRGDSKELDSGTVLFPVQEWLTRYGGRVTVYLIISVIKNAQTEMELYSFPVMLELKNRPDAVDKDDENYESLSTLAEVAKESAQIAEERAKEIKTLNWSQKFDVDESGDLILTKYDGTTENVGHVKGDTGNPGVYVGSGEMPEDCNVQIDPTGDAIDMNDIATKQYVDEEIATFDFIKVVDTLPESGLPNRIYLVPNVDSAENNLFDEYIWVNDSWEFITTKIVEVELINYAKKEEVNTLKVDYIVEQGTSGIWTYRKWASGIAECWGVLNVTIPNVSKKWPNVDDGSEKIYYSNAFGGERYPFHFLSSPLVNFTFLEVQNKGLIVVAHSFAPDPKTNSPVLFAYSHVLYEEQINGQLHWDIKGRWK